MNAAQQLYYQQTLSDLEIFDYLAGKHPCHRLHYLQMLTEKLSKAYFYGEPQPVACVHTGFARMIRVLSSKRNLWKALQFEKRESFERYLASINPLVVQIERLAPSESLKGPNPEYPWPPPPDEPVEAPARYSFPL